MKTKEELTALKEEVDALSKKLAELSDEELAQVAGGFTPIAKVRPITIDPSQELVREDIP